MALKADRKDIYFDDLEEMPVKARQLYLERKLRQAIKYAYQTMRRPPEKYWTERMSNHLTFKTLKVW